MSEEGIGFLAGGLFLVVVAGWMEWRRRDDCQNAVPVEGTVEYAGVHAGKYPVSANPFGFHPRVFYTYTYGGASYTAESVLPGWDLPLSKHAAERIVGDYFPGETATVYVNRSDPSRTYLERSSRAYAWRVIGVFGLGVVFLLVGVSALGVSPV